MTAWDDPRFKLEHKQMVLSILEEEIRDDVPRLAREEASKLPLLDLIFLSADCPDDIKEMLKLILEGDQSGMKVTGEFLRVHDEFNDYAESLDFAKQMGLINECEDEVTELGKSFIEHVETEEASFP